MKFQSNSLAVMIVLAGSYVAVEAQEVRNNDDPFGSDGRAYRTSNTSGNPFAGFGKITAKASDSVALAGSSTASVTAIRSAGLSLVSPAVDRDEATRKKLQLTADEFSYRGISAGEVFQDLSEKYGLTIVLDRSLDDAGILRTDTDVDFTINSVSAGEAMEMLLEVYEADYIVDRGLIRIISRSVVDDPANFETVILDCKDIILAKQNDDGTAKTALNGNELVELITDFVAPGSWREKGNGDAVIRTHSQYLFVANSSKNVRRVREFLDLIRSQMK